MYIKALRTIIEWDSEQGGAVIINGGETGELRDDLAEQHIEGGTAVKARARAATASGPAVDGKPEDEGDEHGDFRMEHLGFGKFRITGPGITEETIIKGKADAETFIEHLKAAVDGKPEGEDGVSADDDAPVD